MSNPLFLLDLLQCKFEGLDPPRFNKTIRICRAESNKFKVLTVSEDEAKELIKKYQREQFQKKYEEFSVKMEKTLEKLARHETKPKSRFKEVASQVEADKPLINANAQAKIVKIVSKMFRKEIKEHSETVPEEFYAQIETLKEHNPHSTNTKEVENFFSILYGKTASRELVEKMRVQFKLVLGPVREEKGKKEESKEESEVKKTQEDSEKHEETKSEEKEEGKSEEKEEGKSVDKPEEDAKSEAEKSGEEESVSGDEKETQKSDSDSDVPVEADAFFEESEPFNLPSLATGYYSGSESEEELEKADKDSQVEEITKPKRNNRRGQRARRKIWEHKYGKNAKHLVKERQDWYVKKERLREEYEQRQLHREEKHKEWEKRQEEKEKKRKEEERRQAQPMHPSWEAKRKAETSLAHVKFKGKKMKFN